MRVLIQRLLTRPVAVYAALVVAWVNNKYGVTIDTDVVTLGVMGVFMGIFDVGFVLLTRWRAKR